VIKLNNEKTRILRSVLPTLILDEAEKNPVYGYEILVNIRKRHHVYFGPSTIYPVMKQLEKDKYLSSEWNMNTDKPRKIYSITEKGKSHRTKNLAIIADIPILRKA
jgi:PadR family transcriptional regulator, regulatory protein PadR